MSSNWQEIVADWQGELTFSGKNDLGNSVQMGTKKDKNNISPMELLLMGLAGCTGYDVVGILKKKRQELKGFQIKVRAKRADTYPMVYTDIEVEYSLWGTGLIEKDVSRAIELSEDKYCSASAMLGQAANITSTFKIMEAEPKN
jgi:putative redox protein